MSDNVNNPAHYCSHPSGVECIELTRLMGFCRGNALKYLWRAGQKGATNEDLSKAQWYLADVMDNDLTAIYDGSERRQLERLIHRLYEHDSLEKIKLFERIIFGEPSMMLSAIHAIEACKEPVPEVLHHPV